MGEIGCIFLLETVNAAPPRCVVVTSKEFFSMNTTAILTAWPEDERDRKRAPARL